MPHLRKAKKKHDEEKLRKERRAKRYLNQSQTNCAICLDLVTSRGILSVCDHWFCFECIKEWSKNTNTCPLCKERFRCITKYTFSTDSPQKVMRIKDKNLSVVEYHDDDLQVALGLHSDVSASSIDVDDPNDETFEISSYGDDRGRLSVRGIRGSSSTQSRQAISSGRSASARQRVASATNTNTDGDSQSLQVTINQSSYSESSESSETDSESSDSDTTSSISDTPRTNSSIAPANSIIDSISSKRIPGSNKSAQINRGATSTSGKKRKRRKKITMPKPKRRYLQSKQPANNNGWIDMSTKYRPSNSTQAREKKKAKVKARKESSDSDLSDSESSDSEWDGTGDFVARRHRKSAYSDEENLVRRSLNCKTSTQSCKPKKSFCLRSKKKEKEIVSESSSEEDSEIKPRNITNKKKRFADQHNLSVADVDDSVESSETDTEGAYRNKIKKKRKKIISESSSEEDSEIEPRNITNKKKRFADQHNLRVADADDSVESSEKDTEGSYRKKIKKKKKKIISESSSEEGSEIKPMNITNKKKRFADQHNLRVADADDSLESSEKDTEGAYTQYVRSRSAYFHCNRVSKSGNSSKFSTSSRPTRNTKAVDNNGKCSTSRNKCNVRNKSTKNNLRVGVKPQRMEDQEPNVPRPLRLRRSTSNKRINYKEADVFLDVSSESNLTSSDSKNENNSLKNSKVDTTESKNTNTNDSSCTDSDDTAEMARPKYTKSYLRRTIDSVIRSKCLIDVPYESNLINDTSDNVSKDETNDNVQTESLFEDLRDETSVSSVVLSPCVLSQHSISKTSSNVNNILCEVTNKNHNNRIETTPDKKYKSKWKFRKM